METENTQAAAPEATSGIGDIMEGMAGSKTEVKPIENGEKTEGKTDKAEVKNENPAWFSQLHGDILNNKDATEKLVKFGKISDLAQSYLELEGKLGNTLVKPGKEASNEEINAFYKALGKPETAEKYSIEGANADLFKNLAFKNNLTDDQAKALYASF